MRKGEEENCARSPPCDACFLMKNTAMAHVKLDSYTQHIYTFKRQGNMQIESDNWMQIGIEQERRETMNRTKQYKNREKACQTENSL